MAFSGSRVSGSSAVVSAHAFLPLVSGFGGSVGVGCASGVDSLVRSAFPSASVFRVSSFLVGGRVARASFALRSSALVHWVASGGGLLVAFPVGVAPVGLAPCVSFRGFGSGSWGSVALALGLGVSVLWLFLLLKYMPEQQIPVLVCLIGFYGELYEPVVSL